MLPTSPRLESRSTCSSCTAPSSVTATRVSCGVTLIRICSFTAFPFRREPQMNTMHTDRSRAIGCPRTQWRGKGSTYAISLPRSSVSVRAHPWFRCVSSVSFGPLGDHYPEFSQQLGGLEKGQPHDAAVAALEALDEGAGASLDGVGAGLVERLSRFHVGGDALVAERGERHQR